MFSVFPDELKIVWYYLFPTIPSTSRWKWNPSRVRTAAAIGQSRQSQPLTRWRGRKACDRALQGPKTFSRCIWCTLRAVKTAASCLLTPAARIYLRTWHENTRPPLSSNWTYTGGKEEWDKAAVCTTGKTDPRPRKARRCTNYPLSFHHSSLKLSVHSELIMFSCPSMNYSLRN